MTNKPYTQVTLLTNTYTTNIMNPPTLTGGVGAPETKTYIILRHIRINNATAGDITARLYRGATGANASGTEVLPKDVNVPANSYIDYYGYMYFRTADFLVGGASASSSLTITLEGEIGVAD